MLVQHMNGPTMRDGVLNGSTSYWPMTRIAGKRKMHILFLPIFIGYAQSCGSLTAMYWNVHVRDARVAVE